MKHWRHIYYADLAYADDMAASFLPQVAYLAKTDPQAAVYRRVDKATGGVHYFFTPAAAPIADRFRAQKCDQPNVETLGEVAVCSPG